MSHYSTETTDNRTQYFLIMENVTLANGQITDIKQRVSRSEYQAYLKAKGFISQLKEVKV